MSWYIVLEIPGEFIHIYMQFVTRGEALEVIERNFENGYLTGNKFQKTSLNIWQYKNQVLHLLNTKTLRSYLNGTRKTEAGN